MMDSENNLSLRLGHRERLRLRAEEEGWDSLKPYEMVELVLYYAVPRQDVNNVARALVDRFETVGGVFSASEEELRAVPGVTPQMVYWLTATGRLMRAYSLCRQDDAVKIFRFCDLEDYLVYRAGGLTRDECWMLYTDFEDNLMTSSVMCASQVWWDPEYVRRIVMEAVSLEARHAFIVRFVGDASAKVVPEEEQHLVEVSRTMRAIDVELLDCVLVGNNGIYSMNVNGNMKSVRRETEHLAFHERYVGSDGDQSFFVH